MVSHLQGDEGRWAKAIAFGGGDINVETAVCNRQVNADLAVSGDSIFNTRI